MVALSHSEWMKDKEGEVSLEQGSISLFQVQEAGCVLLNDGQVFYKRSHRLDRDLTLCVIKAFASWWRGENDEGRRKPERGEPSPPLRVCELFGGSGVRSLRLVLQLGMAVEVTCNDHCPQAVDAIRRNAAANNVLVLPYACTNDREPSSSSSPSSRVLFVSQESAAEHLQKQHTYYDVIDLDPFGSIHLLLPLAVQAIQVGGLLCITTFDTSDLSGGVRGSRVHACEKKWGGRPLRGKGFEKQRTEQGALRLILQAASHHAASCQPARRILPLFCLSLTFCYRLFVQVLPAVVPLAAASPSSSSFCSTSSSAAVSSPSPPLPVTVNYCLQCGWFRELFGKEVSKKQPAPETDKSEKCCYCQAQHLYTAGPFYAGIMLHHAFLSHLLHTSCPSSFASSEFSSSSRVCVLDPFDDLKLACPRLLFRLLRNAHSAAAPVSDSLLSSTSPPLFWTVWRRELELLIKDSSSRRLFSHLLQSSSSFSFSTPFLPPLSLSSSQLVDFVSYCRERGVSISYPTFYEHDAINFTGGSILELRRLIFLFIFDNQCTNKTNDTSNTNMIDKSTQSKEKGFRSLLDDTAIVERLVTKEADYLRCQELSALSEWLPLLLLPLEAFFCKTCPRSCGEKQYGMDMHEEIKDSDPAVVEDEKEREEREITKKATSCLLPEDVFLLHYQPPFVVSSSSNSSSNTSGHSELQVEDQEEHDDEVLLANNAGIRKRQKARDFWTVHKQNKKQKKKEETTALAQQQGGKPIATGIGFELLQKMGWTEGTGLGREEDDGVRKGRLEPVEASCLRSAHDKQGIGHGGSSQENACKSSSCNGGIVGLKKKLCLEHGTKGGWFSCRLPNLDAAVEAVRVLNSSFAAPVAAVSSSSPPRSSLSKTMILLGPGEHTLSSSTEWEFNVFIQGSPACNQLEANNETKKDRKDTAKGSRCACSRVEPLEKKRAGDGDGETYAWQVAPTWLLSKLTFARMEMVSSLGHWNATVNKYVPLSASRAVSLDDEPKEKSAGTGAKGKKVAVDMTATNRTVLFTDGITIGSVASKATPFTCTFSRLDIVNTGVVDSNHLSSSFSPSSSSSLLHDEDAQHFIAVQFASRLSMQYCRLKTNRRVSSRAKGGEFNNTSNSFHPPTNGLCPTGIAVLAEGFLFLDHCHIECDQGKYVYKCKRKSDISLVQRGVFLNGSARAVILHSHISHPLGTGMEIAGDSLAFLSHCHVFNAAKHGLVVTTSSCAHVVFSKVLDSGGVGCQVTEQACLSGSNSLIAGTQKGGMLVMTGASVVLQAWRWISSRMAALHLLNGAYACLFKSKVVGGQGIGLFVQEASILELLSGCQVKNVRQAVISVDETSRVYKSNDVDLQVCNTLRR